MWKKILGGIEVWCVLNNNQQSKILAGKSVYGLEFGETEENSSENCNILLVTFE